jgi:hypothetical protein
MNPLNPGLSGVEVVVTKFTMTFGELGPGLPQDRSGSNVVCSFSQILAIAVRAILGRK